MHTTLTRGIGGSGYVLPLLPASFIFSCLVVSTSSYISGYVLMRVSPITKKGHCYFHSLLLADLYCTVLSCLSKFRSFSFGSVLSKSSPNILELELKLSSTELNFSPSLEEEKLQFNLPSSILIPPSTCNAALEVERPLFGLKYRLLYML